MRDTLEQKKWKEEPPPPGPTPPLDPDCPLCGKEEMVRHALNGGALARLARAGHLFLTIPHSRPVFAPTSPNNLEYLLAVSKNLAHPLHPVYDDGNGGGWKWWE